MKKLLLLIVLFVVCAGMYAQFTPYGQVRLGYWYEILSEIKVDDAIVRNDRILMDLALQGNSRVGFDFTHGDLTSKVELGLGNNATLRLAYVKQNFGSWSLLVGQDAVANNRSNQAFGEDLGFLGYGAIDGGRLPQIRFDMDVSGDRFYLGLVRPTTTIPTFFEMPNWNRNPYCPNWPTACDGSCESCKFLRAVDKNLTGIDYVDALIPTILIGYDVNRGNLKLSPMAMVNVYNFNKDRTSQEAVWTVKDDEDNDITVKQDLGFSTQVTSWLIAITADAKFDDLSLKFHANYGQNVGHMNLMGTKFNPVNTAMWNIANQQTAHIVSLGGYLTAGYDINPNFNINAGFGYAISQSSSGRKEYFDDKGDKVYESENDGKFHYLDGRPAITRNEVAKERDFYQDYSRWALYAQAVIKLAGSLQAVPELGFFNDGEDFRYNELGTRTYAGVQLRYSFK
jgi:hypothetical protein